MPRNSKRKKQAALEPEQAAEQESGNGILGPDIEAEEAEEKSEESEEEEEEEEEDEEEEEEVVEERDDSEDDEGANAGEQQEQCVTFADFVINKRPHKWITDNLLSDAIQRALQEVFTHHQKKVLKSKVANEIAFGQKKKAKLQKLFRFA